MLAKVLHRPALFRIPAAMVKLAFGSMAVETILASQNAVPAKLLATGFTFQLPHLEDALRDVLRS
jgi:NAD dependent epimerase/dehydratase family enzyme